MKWSLLKLTEMGYLTKGRDGRNNTYRLQERFVVEDGLESPVATFTADYVPLQMRSIQDRIQEMLRNGEIARGQTVHVSLNVQVVANTVQINAGHGVLVAGNTSPPSRWGAIWHRWSGESKFMSRRTRVRTATV